MKRSDSCQTYGAVVDRLREGIECFYKEREVIIGTVGTEDGKVVVIFSQGEEKSRCLDIIRFINWSCHLC